MSQTQTPTQRLASELHDFRDAGGGPLALAQVIDAVVHQRAHAAVEYFLAGSSLPNRIVRLVESTVERLLGGPAVPPPAPPQPTSAPSPEVDPTRYLITHLTEEGFSAKRIQSPMDRRAPLPIRGVVPTAPAHGPLVSMSVVPPRPEPSKYEPEPDEVEQDVQPLAVAGPVGVSAPVALSDCQHDYPLGEFSTVDASFFERPWHERLAIDLEAASHLVRDAEHDKLAERLVQYARDASAGDRLVAELRRLVAAQDERAKAYEELAQELRTGFAQACAHAEHWERAHRAAQDAIELARLERDEARDEAGVLKGQLLNTVRVDSLPVGARCLVPGRIGVKADDNGTGRVVVDLFGRGGISLAPDTPVIPSDEPSAEDYPLVKGSTLKERDTIIVGNLFYGVHATHDGFLYYGESIPIAPELGYHLAKSFVEPTTQVIP